MHGGADEPGCLGDPLASKCVPGPAHALFGADRISKSVYDRTGRVTESWDGVGTPLERREAAYTYNANDQKLSLIDARGYKAGMRYDGLGRQICWIFPSKTAAGTLGGDCVTGDFERYGYDSNGNRTSLTAAPSTGRRRAPARLKPILATVR